MTATIAEKIGEFSFEPATNEHSGYTKRLDVSGYAGRVVFSFQGERERRNFFLLIEFSDDAHRETACVSAADAGTLTALMNDDEQLTWVAREADYSQVLEIPAQISR